MDEVVRGETVRGPGVGGAPVQVRGGSGWLPRGVCGDGDEALVRRVIQAVSGRPVLVVGARAGFCAAGGMVTFRRERARIAVEIHLAAVTRAKLIMEAAGYWMSQPSTENPGIAERAGRLVRTGSVERKLRARGGPAATAAALLLVSVGVATIDFLTVRRQMVEHLADPDGGGGRQQRGRAHVPAPLTRGGAAGNTEAQPAPGGGRPLHKRRALFHGYERQGRRDRLPREVPLLGVHFRERGIEVTQPVVREGRMEGYLWLRSDLEDLHIRMRRYVWLAVLLLPLSFWAAAWLGARLQCSATGPILRLCESMEGGLRAQGLHDSRRERDQRRTRPAH